MFNLRYHIASLVAVFLALAAGLVLGTVVVERGALDAQRNTLVKSLQTDFSGLRQENADLKKERDRERAFVVETAPILTSGLLKGKTIAVVTNAGRNDALPITQEALRSAGAETVVVTFRDKNLGLDSEEVSAAISAVVTRTPGPAGAGDPIVTGLAQEWSQRDASPSMPMTDALRRSGALSVDGAAAPSSLDGVVLLASFDGQADPALVALAAELQKAGARAAGVEMSGGSTGVSSAALGAGLSTVDAVDLPEGPVSLVYILARKAEGHYGIKPGATSAFPKLR